MRKCLLRLVARYTKVCISIVLASANTHATQRPNWDGTMMPLIHQQRRRIWQVKKIFNRMKCWVGCGRRVLADGLVIHCRLQGIAHRQHIGKLKSLWNI